MIDAARARLLANTPDNDTVTLLLAVCLRARTALLLPVVPIPVLLVVHVGQTLLPHALALLHDLPGDLADQMSHLRMLATHPVPLVVPVDQM